MKNIAIICGVLHTGGAERIAGMLSKELSEKYNVYLFLIDTSQIQYEYGGTIIDIASYGPYYETTIRKLKAELQIDVAISFLRWVNLINLRTRGRERVILSERSTLETMIPKPLSDEYKVKKYYNMADEIVACSEGIKYGLINTYGVEPDIITTIYNFIDKKTIMEKATENLDESVQTFLDNAEYFVSVGRLNSVKNHKRLIKQFCWFHREDKKKLKLLIVGNGEQYHDLCQLINYFNLGDYIKIIPHTGNPFKYIANAKALVVSSYSEGLPNVILEAMTLRCPIIATDCMSGPRELLKGTNDYQQQVEEFEVCKRGVLVNNNRSEDSGDTFFMADAMKWVCENEKQLKKIKDNQMKYMLAYTNNRILQKWLEIIKKEGRKTDNIYEMERKLIETIEHVYIYGAGKIGVQVYNRLKTVFSIEAFVVTKKKTGQDSIAGIPVKELNEVDKYGKKAVFIIAAGGKNQDEMIEALKQHKLNNIVFPFN